MLEKLDPETREKYLAGELTLEELEGLGMLPPMDYGEEGELEMGEEEGEDETEEGNKRQK
jgi:hypothetical protein